MPQPPKGGTQLDVAIFTVDRDAWGHACRAELEELKEVLRSSIDQPKETP